ncbi:hypothetical protein A1OE_321 [Candidatus Endolissoclinum faulkneri L2]|uniref:Uncharacterized protein n=1 Tax=Candidatus Endolissoclinum faulkneri L2 TaxID=1193729 RepID=K7Z3H0_9PROT|nr:hypothetical protein A1OE_321 [Candidatus Endolissoclinum faulkneri L2]
MSSNILKNLNSRNTNAYYQYYYLYYTKTVIVHSVSKPN